MKFETTNRGFAVATFTDRYGAVCSLQKSSLAGEDAIWLGPNDADPKYLVPGEGWKPFKLPDGLSLTTRMHLTQEHVRALLPALTLFAETGELPASADAQASPECTPHEP